MCNEYVLSKQYPVIKQYQINVNYIVTLLNGSLSRKIMFFVHFQIDTGLKTVREFMI